MTEKKKPTLIILAAGMASRYGSLKQVDSFGPHGETIIDYSIYDAIRAGFGKVVFVIREEFVGVMKGIFDEKLKDKVQVEYAFQSNDLSEFGIDKQIERAKPWGTAHAVLSARKFINEPFCVINADDFYGRDAFEKMADFLTNEVNDSHMALVGYQLQNTLSDHGYVSRGVCEVDDQGYMLSVTERTKIYYQDGSKKIVFEEDGSVQELDPMSRVSMNFWGFSETVFDVAEKMLHEFVEKNADDPKSEFYIPSVADHLVQTRQAKFKVLPTASKWFGVTYKEDKEIVQDSISKLIEQEVYPKKLF